MFATLTAAMAIIAMRQPWSLQPPPGAPVPARAGSGVTVSMRTVRINTHVTALASVIACPPWSPD